MSYEICISKGIKGRKSFLGCALSLSVNVPFICEEGSFCLR